jgi:putative membrane protein (TIGR04086 family)
MMEKKMISIGRIKVKAIVLGFLVDTLGSLLCALTLFIFWPAHAFVENSHVLIVDLIVGFGFTCLGGYVAGRICKESQILHGGIVGVLGLILGVILYPDFSGWFDVIGALGMVPVGMLGGYFSKIKPTN